MLRLSAHTNNDFQWTITMKGDLIGLGKLSTDITNLTGTGVRAQLSETGGPTTTDQDFTVSYQNGRGKAASSSPIHSNSTAKEFKTIFDDCFSQYLGKISVSLQNEVTFSS